VFFYYGNSGSVWIILIKRKMIITKDFIKKSIIDEYYCSYLLEWQGDNAMQEDISHEIIQALPESIQPILNKLITIAINLNNKNYTEVRTAFGIRDNFSFLCEMFKTQRQEFKSLLQGIIWTTSFSNLQQIRYFQGLFIPNDMSHKDYNMSEKGFACNLIIKIRNFGNSSLGWTDRHDLLLSKLLEVNSMDDLYEFNDFFHRIIVESFSDLLLIFETRMEYTIDYALGYPELYDAFSLFKNDFEKFIKEITVVRLKLT
jgi:hypothetical protein